MIAARQDQDKDSRYSLHALVLYARPPCRCYRSPVLYATFLPHPKLLAVPRPLSPTHLPVLSLTTPSHPISISTSSSLQTSKLIFRIRPLSPQRNIVQLRLRRHDHLPRTHKPKRRGRRTQEDLSNQNTLRIPDSHAIADARVYVPPGVAVDAVGEAGRGVGEGCAGGEGAVEGDGVAVAMGKEARISGLRLGWGRNVWIGAGERETSTRSSRAGHRRGRHPGVLQARLHDTHALRRSTGATASVRAEGG